MTKRFILFGVLIFTAVFGILKASGEDKSIVAAKIYVVDARLMRLIPLKCELVDNSVDVMASQMLGKLSCGFDENKKIRRLIPEERRSLSVEIHDTTAVVNIRTKYFDILPQNKELERLVIYQIVNSLSSIEGIDYVEFTVDNQVQKDFAGFLDMRETFVPDCLL